MKPGRESNSFRIEFFRFLKENSSILRNLALWESVGDFKGSGAFQSIGFPKSDQVWFATEGEFDPRE